MFFLGLLIGVVATGAFAYVYPDVFTKWAKKGEDAVK